MAALYITDVQWEQPLRQCVQPSQSELLEPLDKRTQMLMQHNPGKKEANKSTSPAQQYSQNPFFCTAQHVIMNMHTTCLPSPIWPSKTQLVGGSTYCSVEHRWAGSLHNVCG